MRHRSQSDTGFTLVELLIVIVILGVLAAVVVFAVGGIRDQGEVAASEADESTLVTAQEVHKSQFGTYATEAELVAAGFLRDESSLWDIEVAPGGADYTIGATGSFTPATPADPNPPAATTTTTVAPAAPTPQPTSFSGHGGTSLGTGSRNLVIIGTSGQSAVLWNNLLSELPSDTTVTWLNQGDVTTSADVDAVRAAADYVIAADGYPITHGGNSTYVGIYLSSVSSSPSGYWWTYQLGVPSLAQLEAGLS